MMYSAHKWCAWITTVYTLFIRQQNRQHRRQPVEHNTMSVHRRSQEFVTEGHSWGPKDRNSRPKSRIGFLGEGAAPSLPARSSGERRKLPQQGSGPQMHFGLTKSPENAQWPQMSFSFRLSIGVLSILDFWRCPPCSTIYWRRLCVLYTINIIIYKVNIIYTNNRLNWLPVKFWALRFTECRIWHDVLEQWRCYENLRTWHTATTDKRRRRCRWLETKRRQGTS